MCIQMHTGHVSATFSVSIYCVRAGLTLHRAPHRVHRAVGTLNVAANHVAKHVWSLGNNFLCCGMLRLHMIACGGGAVL